MFFHYSNVCIDSDFQFAHTSLKSLQVKKNLMGQSLTNVVDNENKIVSSLLYLYKTNLFTNYI